MRAMFTRALRLPFSRIPRPRALGWLALSLLFISTLRTPARANDDFLVIAHPDSPIQRAHSGSLTEIFLKKVTRWGNGDAIRPVDQRADSGVRKSFSRVVLKRSVSAVRSYWQQRIFTGRDVPPPELDSDNAIVHYVLTHRGAIGYVSSDARLGRAKVITIQ